MSKNQVSTNSREKILKLEESLLCIADGINVEGDGKHILTDSKIAPIKHTFADGVYIRQMELKMRLKTTCHLVTSFQLQE